MACLATHFNTPLGVIAVGEDVVAGRQTVRRTLLLHLVPIGALSNFRILNVPQSCVAEYIGKHGASVPSCE